MTKSLISNQYMSDIADAIRTKKGTTNTIKTYELSDEISSITGGGVEFDTTLTLTSDKEKTSGAVTLYATLNDEYVETGITNTGLLENAPINLYKNNTLLATQNTNSNGVATFNQTINEDTTFTVTYEGESGKYNTSTASKTIQYTEYLYHPNLDGTDPITTICSERPFTTGNGICGGYSQQGYISDGWDNTVNWKLTATWQSSQWDGGMWLLNYPYTDCDHEHYDVTNGKKPLLWLDGNIKYCNGNGYSSTGIPYTRNSTFNIKITKIGEVITYYENDVQKGQWTWTGINNQPKMYIGVNTWGGSGSVNTLSNIIVEEIE